MQLTTAQNKRRQHTRFATNSHPDLNPGRYTRLNPDLRFASVLAKQAIGVAISTMVRHLLRTAPTMSKIRIYAAVITAIFAGSATAEPGFPEVRQWREANELAIVTDLVTLLSIPNVASDSVNIRRNAEYISDQFSRRGLEMRLLEVEGSPPAVFGERRVPGADTTLMLYIHYDGQPVNPADWASDPWQPVLRTDTVEAGGAIRPLEPPFDPSWRVFARSASDDKGPLIGLLAALDAMAANDIPLSVNLKVFFEGEEEAGSPNLERMLDAHRDLLDADLWLFCDGPVHQSRRWQLSYGVRGSDGFDLTVYGPTRPLHSGHYGNWAPNPIAMLMDLISGMRDSRGNILIPGFHDEVIAPTTMELEAIAATPSVDENLIDELGIGRPEAGERLELSILRPAFNLRGIQSGQTGTAARNVIEVSATASIGLRLVPAQTPEHVRRAVADHIRRQGWYLADGAPTPQERRNHERIASIEWSPAGYPAYRTPMETLIARRVAAIVDELSPEPLIEVPTMGGSLPIHLISEATGSPLLILPIANHDNNQHGRDENIRLQNLWDSIEIYAAVLSRL